MQRKRVEISTGYKPRTLQAALHRALKRFNVIVCHRRFGKTVFSCNEMVDQGLRNNRKNPQYAYIAPTYGQAKRVAWDILKDVTKDFPDVKVNEAELRIEIPRPDRGDFIRFILLGAENPGTLRGIYLDGVLLDEFAEMDPVVWSQVIRPALSDRLGWAIFIGTPKGQNAFFDMHNYAKMGDPDKQLPPPDDWYTIIHKASETGIIDQGELDAARAIMTEEEYAQEYECSFSAALVGAYYGKQMEEAETSGRVTAVPHDTSCTVDTFWDLGIDDTTVIWLGQKVGKEWHFIDYIEMSGEGLEYYVKELNLRKYNYGKHYLPHDAEARELGTGKSRVETLVSLGLRKEKIVVVPRQEVADGINAVRMILARCWFDATRCKKGVLSLKSYERKWDSKNKIYQQRPLHNWASHGSDAFRTFAMGIDERAPSEESKKQYPRRTQSEYNIFTRR